MTITFKIIICLQFAIFEPLSIDKRMFLEEISPNVFVFVFEQSNQ